LQRKIFGRRLHTQSDQDPRFCRVHGTWRLRPNKTDLGYDTPFDNKNSGQALSLVAKNANPVAGGPHPFFDGAGRLL